MIVGYCPFILVAFIKSMYSRHFNDRECVMCMKSSNDRGKLGNVTEHGIKKITTVTSQTSFTQNKCLSYSQSLSELLPC